MALLLDRKTFAEDEMVVAVGVRSPGRKSCSGAVLIDAA